MQFVTLGEEVGVDGEAPGISRACPPRGRQPCAPRPPSRVAVLIVQPRRHQQCCHGCRTVGDVLRAAAPACHASTKDSAAGPVQSWPGPRDQRVELPRSSCDRRAARVVVARRRSAGPSASKPPMGPPESSWPSSRPGGDCSPPEVLGNLWTTRKNDARRARTRTRRARIDASARKNARVGGKEGSVGGRETVRGARREGEEHRGAGGVFGVAGAPHHRLLQQPGPGREHQEVRHRQGATTVRSPGSQPDASAPISHRPHHTHASPK